MFDGMDLEKFDEVLIPVNDSKDMFSQGEHWALLHIKNTKLILYDSCANFQGV